MNELAGHTFESYVWHVWWPMLAPTLGDKNRVSHRRNAEVAVSLRRYGLGAGDRRMDSLRRTGDSVRLADMVSDDLKLAVVRRRSMNGGTAAVNQRRLDALRDSIDDIVQVSLTPESASAGTVRAFAITLGMIIRATTESGHVHGNPMSGVMAMAPKPRASGAGSRLVPTLEEIFDLADAIASLGPLMKDGRTTGERSRSLILAAGTLGPRPVNSLPTVQHGCPAPGPHSFDFREPKQPCTTHGKARPGDESVN